MTIRETSNLGSLIVRRLEKHGKFREKWCPERLEKPTETIGHRQPAQTSERYFRKVATGHHCFQTEKTCSYIVKIVHLRKTCRKAPKQALPPTCSLSKIGIIGHCPDLSMIQSDQARTFLFRLGPPYAQNQSGSRQVSTRPSWQKHLSSRRVRW